MLLAVKAESPGPGLPPVPEIRLCWRGRGAGGQGAGASGSIAVSHASRPPGRRECVGAHQPWVSGPWVNWGSFCSQTSHGMRRSVGATMPGPGSGWLVWESHAPGGGERASSLEGTRRHRAACLIRLPKMLSSTCQCLLWNLFSMTVHCVSNVCWLTCSFLETSTFPPLILSLHESKWGYLCTSLF